MVFCIIASIVPVQAQNNKKAILLSSNTENGKYEEVVQIEDTTFNYSETGDTTKCVSYNRKENLVDYVEYCAGADYYLRATYKPAQKVPSSVSDYIKDLRPSTVETKVEVYEVVNQIYPATSPKSYSGDVDIIMNTLFQSGYHPAYTNENSRPVVVSGTYVFIKDSLSYSIVKKSAYTAAAKTLLSIIATVLSTPISKLVAILSIITLVDGVYQLTQAFTFNTYKVSTNWYTRGFINNIAYSEVWKTTNMTAKMGDIGTAITINNSACDSNYDNDRKIADIAYANYQVGYHY